MRTVCLNTLVVEEAPIIYGILMPGQHVAGGVPVVKVRNMDHGRIDVSKLLRTSPEIDAMYRRSRLRSGDILLSIRGTTGLVAVVPPPLDGGNITQDSARIRIEDPAVRDYLLHALASPFVQRQIALHTIGQAVKGINIASVRKLQIPLPKDNNERDAIARLFRELDRLQHLIEDCAGAKGRLKRALLQQLLTGKRRFPEFRQTEWRRSGLGDVSRDATRRNNGRLGVERVMGVLKHEGLVPMRERSIGSDLNRYKVVSPSAFAYNPMRINIGSIAYSSHRSEVLVSPDYEVFECDSSRLDPRFLDHVRRSASWASFMRQAGSGSVRVRIYFEDLAQFVLPLPSIKEQRRIASLLDLINHEIVLLDEQLTALRKLRRGLMQKLLTGELEMPESMEPRLVGAARK